MMEIIEELKTRKALVMGHISQDKGQYGDPFLCQHMRGRVACEEDEVRWLDKLIAILEK